MPWIILRLWGFLFTQDTEVTKSLHTEYATYKLYIRTILFEGATSRDRLDHCSGLAIKYVVIALLKETIALNFALNFVTINILNEERKRECFFVEFGSNF